MILFADTKDRVKFSRKKKCDVCHEVKMVAHECEICYNKGFDSTADNLFKAGKEEAIEAEIKFLESCINNTNSVRKKLKERIRVLSQTEDKSSEENK